MKTALDLSAPLILHVILQKRRYRFPRCSYVANLVDWLPFWKSWMNVIDYVCCLPMRLGRDCSAVCFAYRRMPFGTGSSLMLVPLTVVKNLSNVGSRVWGPFSSFTFSWRAIRVWWCIVKTSGSIIMLSKSASNDGAVTPWRCEFLPSKSLTCAAIVRNLTMRSTWHRHWQLWQWAILTVWLSVRLLTLACFCVQENSALTIFWLCCSGLPGGTGTLVWWSMISFWLKRWMTMWLVPLPKALQKFWQCEELMRRRGCLDMLGSQYLQNWELSFGGLKLTVRKARPGLLWNDWFLWLTLFCKWLRCDIAVWLCWRF